MVLYYIAIIYFLFLIFLIYLFINNILLKRNNFKNSKQIFSLKDKKYSDIFESLNNIFSKIGYFSKRILLKSYLLKIENLIFGNNEYGNTFLTAESFIGFKTILALLMFLLPLIVIKKNLIMIILCLAGLFLGFFIPDFLLQFFNLKRYKKLDKDLPCFIDLLYIATLSGQNIYNSIKIVVEKFESQLSNEFKSYLNQINLGIGKQEAYYNILQKNNSNSFKSFIFTLQQAESYGSSISNLLKQKADFLRFELSQEVERKVRLISIKMLFPLIFLILPSFILLVCGPLVFLIGGNNFLNL